jgi:CheY-like chemotaxis protein
MIQLFCLVEDDAITSLLLRKLLDKTGLVESVISFQNGEEAYHHLKILHDEGEFLPEILFLDINMPVWSGWDFLEEYLKLSGSEKTTVFIHTSSVSRDDYQKAEDYGLRNRYLLKPVGLDQLRLILKEYLENSES